MTPRERFDALPQAHKDKLLDKYRDWNTEHIDWWDSTYDMFKHDMEQIGIEVDSMYFSGFWSQGDGACFEGSVTDWGKFLTAVGYTESALINHAEHHFSFSVKQQGHYYHENCTWFTSDMPLPEHNEDMDFAEHYAPHLEEDSIQEAVWLVLLSGYSESSFDTEFTELFKDKMRELYRLLEQEHDYLTSDEAILDSLEANDQLEEAINEITQEYEDA
jgi:hypothetical protein